MSIVRMKIGGYKIACHIVAELSIERLPKAKKSSSGDVLMKVSTIPCESPEGDIAGARATNMLTFSLRLGLIEREANACAVPWEKPMYDKDFCPVVERM